MSLIDKKLLLASRHSLIKVGLSIRAVLAFYHSPLFSQSLFPEIWKIKDVFSASIETNLLQPLFTRLVTRDNATAYRF